MSERCPLWQRGRADRPARVVGELLSLLKIVFGFGNGRTFGQNYIEISMTYIRDHPAAPRSPWQNGYAERLIGSIRRERRPD